MRSLRIYSDPLTCTLSLPIDKSIDMSAFPYILKSSVIFSIPDFISLSPHTSIIYLTCNTSLTLAVSTSGQVFGWGEDSYGLLGLDSKVISTPTELLSLSCISQCSLGLDHAAAINTQGQLFTWGSERHPKLGDSVYQHTTPSLVQSSKGYNIIEVHCGSTYTCFRTDGCYLMIYGLIGRTHTVKKDSPSKPNKFSVNKEYLPYSHPSLDCQALLQVCAAPEFIVVMNEDGEVSVIDSCMQLVKIVGGFGGIRSIVMNGSDVWALGEGELLVCRNETVCRSQFDCPVKKWSAERYGVKDEVRVFEWGDGVIVETGGDEEDFWRGEDVMSPRIEEGSRRTSIESPRMIFIEKMSPEARRESLNRLYPTGDNQVLINKIMKCQQEFSNRGTIKDAFKKIIHPIAKDAFFIIQQYSRIKKQYFLFNNTVKLFCTLENVINKKWLNRFCRWRRAVRMQKLTMKTNSKIAEILKTRKTRNNLKSLSDLSLIFKRKQRKDLQYSINTIKAYSEEKKSKLKALRIICYSFRMKSYKCVVGIWKAIKILKIKQELVVKDLSEKLLRKCFDDLIKSITESAKKRERYIERVAKAFKKINSVIELSDWKLQLKYFKEIAFQHKANKLKKQVYIWQLSETLVLILNKHVKRKLKSAIRSFDALQVRKFNRKASLKLRHLSNKLSKRLSKPFFSKISKSENSLALLTLQRLLAHKLLKTLVTLKATRPKTFFPALHHLLFTLNKILCRTLFSQKLSSLTIIKSHTGFLESFYDRLHSFLDHHFEEILDYNSLQVSKSELNLQKINSSKPETLTATNSPKSNISGSHPTHFRPGELLRYQKYLINRKKLEMIKEDSSYSDEEQVVYYRRRPKLHKKKSNQRPPWKPSSASANFTYKPKKESALVKGIKYYERLVHKQIKNISIVNVAKMNSCHQQSTASGNNIEFVGDSKIFNSQAFRRNENFSPSSVSDDLMIDFGLGVVVSDRILRKKQKINKRFGIARWKERVELKKKEMKRQKDSPIVVAKVSMAGWKVRMIHIGIEKFRKYWVGRKLKTFKEIREKCKKEQKMVKHVSEIDLTGLRNHLRKA